MRALLSPIILLFSFSCNSIYAGWVELKPVRQPEFQGVLGEIDSQLQRGHIYRDADKITWGHETTHGINARIRNSFRVKNGYYCLNNIAFTISSPRLRLSDIARNVPQQWRGSKYQLYLIQQQRYWNDSPFYILDELTAYTNGAIVGVESGNRHRASESFEAALEMLSYTIIAKKMSAAAGFEEQKNLEEFLNWYVANRIIWCKILLEGKGWLSVRHAQLLQRCEENW